MEDSHRLERLRQMNAEQWSTLKELHEKCASTTTPPNQSAVLTFELETLQSTTSHRQHGPLDFTQEVVNSYDELRQTNALLQQRIERERIKLDAIKQRNVQHKSVNEALLSMQRNTLHHGQDQCDEDNNPQRENEWILHELHNVAQQVTKRRRLENDGTNKRKENAWNLEKIVLKLVERYLASDPYVLVSSLPVEQWQVDFLCSCHVIRIHPDNPNLVRLSDYNGSLAS